jgi:1-deoxyxylulose-5-phosphate synthase
MPSNVSPGAVVQAFDSPLDEPSVNAVQRVAEARGASMAQVALAWVLNSPVVSAPIVGATNPITRRKRSQHSVCTLPTTRFQSLEERYTPHGPSWF